MTPTYSRSEAQQVLESDQLLHHWQSGTFIDLPCFKSPVTPSYDTAEEAFCLTFGEPQDDLYLSIRYIDYLMAYVNSPLP